MKIISVAEFRRRFSHYLRAAQRGQDVVVANRGRPVAKLTSIQTGAAGLDARSRELVEAGLARAPEGRLPRDLSDLDRPADPAGLAVKALLHERRSGR